VTSTHFRSAYDAARAAGYPGTRSEFATMVLLAPTLFRGQVVASARAWERHRGSLLCADTTPARRRGLTLLDVADG